jgi:GTPase
MRRVSFDADIKIGMVIIAKTDTPPKAVRRFEGQVLIL